MKIISFYYIANLTQINVLTKIEIMQNYSRPTPWFKLIIVTNAMKEFHSCELSSSTILKDILKKLKGIFHSKKKFKFITDMFIF